MVFPFSKLLSFTKNPHIGYRPTKNGYNLPKMNRDQVCFELNTNISQTKNNAFEKHTDSLFCRVNLQRQKIIKPKIILINKFYSGFPARNDFLLRPTNKLPYETTLDKSTKFVWSSRNSQLLKNQIRFFCISRHNKVRNNETGSKTRVILRKDFENFYNKLPKEKLSPEQNQKVLLAFFEEYIVSKQNLMKQESRFIYWFLAGAVMVYLGEYVVDLIKEVLPQVMKYLKYTTNKVLTRLGITFVIIDEKINRITVYHECGHALVAYFAYDSLPFNLSIERSFALEHTAFMPSKGFNYVTKKELLSTIDALMGGRAAEELVFGSENITSRGTCDLEKASELASLMVKYWGMSEKIGLHSLYDMSAQKRKIVETEVENILQNSYNRAKSILSIHLVKLIEVSEAVLKHEVLDKDDFCRIMQGNKPKQKPIIDNFLAHMVEFA